MLAEGSDAQQAGDEATINTILYSTLSDKTCVEFYYFMRGSDVGTLQVSLLDGNGNFVQNVWKEQGDQGSFVTLKKHFFRCLNKVKFKTVQNKVLKTFKSKNKKLLKKLIQNFSKITDLYLH